MPQPSSPPYAAGAITIPRQLNRWLDVNTQNGPLTRARYFIVLPAFTVTGTWIGVSDIVAAFNFEATNNFSIPCNVAAGQTALPVAFQVVNVGGNQTGSVIGNQNGGGIS